jgi:SAM-dependent methyltransferase
MSLLDALDRVVSRPFHEFRQLPPNRMRIRVGLGNRLFFNQARYLQYGAATVVELMSEGLLSLKSDVLDIGSGCGRFAAALERFRFSGHYVGIDVDKEMVEWCRRRFPADRFEFHYVNVHSSVYNPDGEPGPYRVPLDGAKQDLVVAQSLLTHLLPDDLQNYLREAYRVLRPGGNAYMGAFCRDHMQELGLLGGRWNFTVPMGPVWVESEQFPEAAVAYARDYLLDAAKAAGFADVELVPRQPQSLLRCRR